MGTKKISVLIIEDDHSDALILIEELELYGAKCNWLRVDSYPALVEALESEWDVVLCDCVVPGMQYQKSLELVRNKKLTLPFIAVSGKRGEEFAVEAIQAGCDDFIVKDRLIRLGASVHREIKRCEEMQKATILHDKLVSELDRSVRLSGSSLTANELAHNLNNLLTVIMGNVEIALISSSALPIKRYLEKTLEAAESASGITHDLLRRGTSRKIHLQKVDLCDLLKKCLSLIEGQIPTRVAVSLCCDTGLPKVSLDPNVIEQVILNLILNARDAIADKGNVSITANVTNGYWSVKIADTGSGISENEYEHIFEPFYTTKGPGGNGLGLSHASQSLRLHGGYINLDSQVGVGSSFELIAPVSAIEVSNVPLPCTAKNKSTGRSR